MSEQNNLQRYQEQDAICKKNIAILEPFLKKFSEEHDAGTRFYEDITVLSGLSLYGSDWFYKSEEGKDWYKRYREYKVSIFTIKWAGASFVVEYYNKSSAEIKNAFMVWQNKKYAVPSDIVVAVRDLFSAQQYRNVIYAAHIEEIQRAERMANNKGGTVR